MDIVVYFFKLLFFRGSPADAPYSRSLLMALVVVQIGLTVFVVARLGESVITLIVMYAVLLAIAAWWTKLVLKKAGKAERFNQVAIAVLGTHVLVAALCVYPHSEQLVLLQTFMDANMPTAEVIKTLSPAQLNELSAQLQIQAAEYIQANLGMLMTAWSFVSTILLFLWVGAATRIMSLALEKPWWNGLMYTGVLSLLELIYFMILASSMLGKA